MTYDYGQPNNLEQRKLKITGLDYFAEYTKNYDTLNNRIESSQFSFSTAINGIINSSIREIFKDMAIGVGFGLAEWLSNYIKDNWSKLKLTKPN